jgi:transcriptional regulator with XRE-family HTH domain
MKTEQTELSLQAFGVLVRETRVRKHLTQDHAARGAGVSRKQWALLEQGHNVSAAFLRKVAVYLELSVIPLGEGLQATTGSGGGVDVTALFGLADELVAFASSFAERLRAFAIDAVLPASERGRDAEAIAAFIARVQEVASEDSKELGRTLHDLSAGAVAHKSSARRDSANPASNRRRRKG